ncbi:TPA: urease accessory protein UreF, partial [Escherichia coli]|nr:urease accessory protein UreF [Escherichia coli]EFJ5757429.1 urease accessory protein UreF [Escherichia coli]EIF6892151.1 urease accessory protein UreF [Escherichia coli]HAG6812942.1 urease accessory protein UreF [Escherichia coli]
MPTPEKRLRLMQLASNSLPVGGYSWSQGLEWAVEAGWVEDSAAFEHW